MISFIFLNVHKNLYQGYKETLVVSLHHSTGNSNLDFRLDHVGVLHREWESFSLVEHNNHLSPRKRPSL